MKITQNKIDEQIIHNLKASLVLVQGQLMSISLQQNILLNVSKADINQWEEKLTLKLQGSTACRQFEETLLLRIKVVKGLMEQLEINEFSII